MKAKTKMFHGNDKSVRKMLQIEKYEPKLDKDGKPIVKDGEEVVYDPMPPLVDALISRVEALINNKTTHCGLTNETLALIVAISEHLEMLAKQGRKA